MNMFLLNISKCILMRKTAIKWNTNNYTGGISEKTFGLVFSKSWTLPAIVWASWPFAVNTKNKRNILHTLSYSNFFCNKKGWWCNFCMNSYTSTNIRFYIYLFFILQKYLKLFCENATSFKYTVLYLHLFWKQQNFDDKNDKYFCGEVWKFRTFLVWKFR